MAVVRYRALSGVLAVAALAVGGCGGGDGDDDVAAGASTTTTTEAVADDGAVDGTTDDGGSESPSAEVPDHLPLELAPGGQVDAVADPTEGSLQDYWFVRVLYPEDAAEDVVAFYDDHLADLGFLDQKIASRPDRVRWLTTPESGIVTMKVDTGQTHYPDQAVLEISWNET